MGSPDTSSNGGDASYSLANHLDGILLVTDSNRNTNNNNNNNNGIDKDSGTTAVNLPAVQAGGNGIVRPIPLKIYHPSMLRTTQSARMNEKALQADNAHSALRSSVDYLEAEHHDESEAFENAPWMGRANFNHFCSVRESGARNPSPVEETFSDSRSWSRYVDFVETYAGTARRVPQGLVQDVAFKPQVHPIIRPIPMRLPVPMIVDAAFDPRNQAAVSHPRVTPHATPSPMPVSTPSPAPTPSPVHCKKVAKYHKDSDDGQQLQEGNLPTACKAARDDLLKALAVHRGNVNTIDFHTQLKVLADHYKTTKLDSRQSVRPTTIEGSWLSLCNSSYDGNLGQNDSHDHLYTLGRLSFNMFFPNNLICSLQGNFNYIYPVSSFDREALDSIPDSLRKDVKENKLTLYTYK
jgi:hypothetical protein